MSAIHHDPLPSREALIRSSIELHKEALSRDLQAIWREAYPNKLMQTVKDKPLLSMLAVAGGAFLLAQMAYGLRRRCHESNTPSLRGSGLLGRMVRALVATL